MITLDILIQSSNSSTYAIMSLKIKLSLSQHMYIQLMKKKLALAVHESHQKLGKSSKYTTIST